MHPASVTSDAPKPPIRRARAVLFAVLFAAGLLASCASTAPTGGDSAPATAEAPPVMPADTAEPAPAEPTPAAEPPAEPAATVATAEAVAAAGPIVCFFGPVRESGAMAAGGGAGEPTANLLLRRSLQPEASRIVEETVRFDRSGGGRARVYTTTFDVDGDAVTLSESGGSYAGSGTLHGEPWRWTAWDLAYMLTSGIRVDARYELRHGGDGGDGGLLLHGEKTAYGPDGSLALTLVEELRQIPAGECTERLAAAREPREDS